MESIYLTFNFFGISMRRCICTLPEVASASEVVAKPSVKECSLGDTKRAAYRRNAVIRIKSWWSVALGAQHFINSFTYRLASLIQPHRVANPNISSLKSVFFSTTPLCCLRLVFFSRSSTASGCSSKASALQYCPAEDWLLTPRRNQQCLQLSCIGYPIRTSRFRDREA